MKNELWTEKYRPLKYTELIFAEDVHHTALKWLKSYPNSGKILLINGPVGIGKTSLVHIISRLLGYKTLEYNLSSSRDFVNDVNNSYKNAMCKTLFFYDDLCDANILKGIKQSKLEIPVILTAENLYIKDVYTINIKRPDIDDAVRLVTKIVESERIGFNISTRIDLVKSFDYDFRAITNFLQLNQKKRKLDPCMKTSSSPFSLVIEMFTKTFDISQFDKSIYSLCYNSYPHNTRILNDCVSISEAYSLVDTLPEKYSFLVVKNLNSLRPGNVKVIKYLGKKENILKYKNDPIMGYLDLYNLKTLNQDNIKHLKEILSVYNIENIKLDLEVQSLSQMHRKSKGFVYRFKKCSVSGYKRYISLFELLDM